MLIQVHVELETFFTGYSCPVGQFQNSSGKRDKQPNHLSFPEESHFIPKGWGKKNIFVSNCFDKCNLAHIWDLLVSHNNVMTLGLKPFDFYDPFSVTYKSELKDS